MPFQFCVTCFLGVRLDLDAPKTRVIEGFDLPITMTLYPWEQVHGQHAVFSGGDFQRETEARTAGFAIQRALILSGALGKFWVKSSESDVSTVALDGLRAVGFPPSVHTSFNPSVFQEKLLQAAPLAAMLSERQRIAAVLISDGLLMPTAAARLVMFVSAVEAMSEQGATTKKEREALSAIAGTDAVSALGSPLADTLRRAINSLRPVGAAAACREKIRIALGDERSGAFRAIYNARSELLHEGKGRDTASRHADVALNLAVDLLRAELEQQVDAATD